MVCMTTCMIRAQTALAVCFLAIVAEHACCMSYITLGLLVSRRQTARVGGSTACMRRRVLGWLHLERGVPLAKLRLAHILPSSDRAGVAVAFDYVQWLVTERSISAFTQGVTPSSPLY